MYCARRVRVKIGYPHTVITTANRHIGLNPSFEMKADLVCTSVSVSVYHHYAVLFTVSRITSATHAANALFHTDRNSNVFPLHFVLYNHTRKPLAYQDSSPTDAMRSTTPPPIHYTAPTKRTYAGLYLIYVCLTFRGILVSICAPPLTSHCHGCDLNLH